MKTKKYYNPKVSILVANYNNEKFLKRTINSLLNQSYKNIEIIVHDDRSTDTSLSILETYKKKIIIIKNKKKIGIGSYDQMNGYYKALQRSSGDIIFFLDSDDCYKLSKISTFVDIYKQSSKNYLIDKPYAFFNQKRKRKIVITDRNNFVTPWPRFSPQSCISIKREFFLRAYKTISIKKFPTIWMDFRLATYIFFLDGRLEIMKDYLTYYQQLDNSASSNYARYSKNWWIRRYEAHQYCRYLKKKLNKSYFITIDYIITRMINLFIK